MYVNNDSSFLLVPFSVSLLRVGDPPLAQPKTDRHRKAIVRSAQQMQITASWGGADVEVEVDEECRSLAALKRALRSALPEEVNLEKVCLEVGGRAMEEEDVVGLVEGSVVAVSPTLAARAAATLREEGRAVTAVGFRAAARAGDVRVCELYLDAGVACPRRVTLLHIACLEGNIALCTRLLDRGFDVDAKERDKDATPLHLAVQVQSTELCTLFLNRGCDREAKDIHEATPLHWAVRQQSIALCALLLDRGCDVTAEGGGMTPLHVAARAGNTLLCTLLLDCGGTVEAEEGACGKTPLHLAVRTCDAELCTLLCNRGSDVNAKDRDGETPLHWAVRVRSTELCTLLFDRGCDINAKDKFGSTPLHFAVRNENAGLFVFLRDRGCDVEAENNSGATPLAKASAVFVSEMQRNFVHSTTEPRRTKDTGPR